MPERTMLLALLLSGCSIPTVSSPGAVGASGPGVLVVDLVDGVSLSDARETTGLSLEWASERSADEALGVVEVADLGRALGALSGNPLVEAAEPSLVYEATGLFSPDDPLYDRQWNFRRIGAPAGWRAGAGQGVVVAVIDTGVTRVPDLAETDVLDGFSFVPGSDGARDDNGHGTHVAGTIAQSTNNGFGVTGIAPRATILPLKALAAQGFGRSEWIASAIDEAADQGAQVVNLSLGGPESEVIRVAVEKALDRGVIIVAAAGNTGREGVSSPASIEGVIGVSATGPDDELAPYSSWGAEVDLSAPGGDKRRNGGGILQDTVDPEKGKDAHAFRELQGTSMATPHVAGAAAVLLGAGASGPEAVEKALTEHAVDLGPPGQDPRFGHGRLDLGASVRAVALRGNGLLFAIGGLVAYTLARLGRLTSPGALFAATLAGALTAGGLFFLPLLPVSVPFGHLLSRPLLLWPAAFLGADWGRFPLVLSAAAPVGLAFLVGPSRLLGHLAAGVAAGAAAWLGWAAVTGEVHPTLLPGSWGTGWLGANALLSLVASMAAFGVRRMRDQEGR